MLFFHYCFTDLSTNLHSNIHTNYTVRAKTFLAFSVPMSHSNLLKLSNLNKHNLFSHGNVRQLHQKKRYQHVKGNDSLPLLSSHRTFLCGWGPQHQKDMDWLQPEKGHKNDRGLEHLSLKTG